MYMCIHMFTNTMYICIHIFLYNTCTCVYICVRYSCIYMYYCIICTGVHIYVYPIPSLTSTRPINVYLLALVHARKYALSVHTHTHTHGHTRIHSSLPYRHGGALEHMCVRTHMHRHTHTHAHIDTQPTKGMYARVSATKLLLS